MEDMFPDTVYLSQAGSGDDAYLNASKTETEAIKATDEETSAVVAEYRLVKVRHRAIVTTIEDAE